MNSNVRFPDDEIVINIDGQIDLSILKVNSSSLLNEIQKENEITTQQIISRTIDLSFRLLLIQHQKYNVWRQRAKILSSNHKIHQLLLLQNESIANSSVATPPVNSNQNNNNSNSNNPNIPNVNNNNNNVNNNSTSNLINTSNNSNTNNTMIAPTNATALNSSTSTTTSTTSFVQRARTKLVSHSQLSRDLPKEISILLPIMSLTRFWVQFDRVRHVVHSIIYPFTGGLSISVHFKFSDLLMSTPSKSNITYNSYPGNSEIALSLGISILKG